MRCTATAAGQPRVEDRLDAGAQIAPVGRLDLDASPLAGQPTLDQDHLAVVVSEAQPAVDRALDLDLQLSPDRYGHSSLSGTG